MNTCRSIYTQFITNKQSFTLQTTITKETKTLQYKNNKMQ